ncbi:MAG: TIGR04283 family arsenosugar biosynthesis glycosyltransferase [Candidatus Eiseniibacteriota bacterium]
MLSVIVPTRGEGRTVLRGLAALTVLPGVDEVVVAAWGERPAVRRWAERCPRLRWVECPRAGRGAQLNHGAAAARGTLLLFLHADTGLPADAALVVRRVLARRDVAGGGFRLAFDVAHPALRMLERLSALAWRGAYFGDQGFFCRRADFEAAGGYPDQPLFEDVDLARRLARRGRLLRLSERAGTSARRFVAAGPWRQLTLNAAILALHTLGVPATALARLYRP